MCEAIDNSNSARKKINTRLITVQGSRVTLVATVMTEGKVTVANSPKTTDEVNLKIAKFLVAVQRVERGSVV